MFNGPQGALNTLLGSIEMKMYFCNLTILFFIAFSSIAGADTTGNIRETISLNELLKRGASVSKVTEMEFGYVTVAVNLDGIKKCRVENFGVYIYEHESHDSILASLSVEKHSGTYNFYAKQSFLSRMGLSIGCSHEGFFGYLEIPLEGL